MRRTALSDTDGSGHVGRGGPPGFHWGSAYDIDFADGEWTAHCRDGLGVLADPLPKGLRLRIVADYTAMPVPRDLPVNGRAPAPGGGQ
jgi:hypothetical protein